MSDETAEIRIIKRKKKHGGHHGGAWKVAYADFVTAMMAFFLVMWIVGLSQDIKSAIAAYFQDPVAFNRAVQARNSPFQLSSTTSESPPALPSRKNPEREKLEQAKKTIEHMVAVTPQFRDLRQHVDIALADEGLRIDLLEAKESLFFDSGSARIKPNTQHLLGLIAWELKKLPNKVIIEGHTDSRPLARTDGYTNWELSADRANSARQVFAAAGVSDKQIAQVRGYAATQPRDPIHPAHFTNRRVSIIVVMSDAFKRQQFRILDEEERPEETGNRQ